MTATADERLERIATAHGKTRRLWLDNEQIDACNECELPHPCPTYVWATTDRDVDAPWQPPAPSPADGSPETTLTASTEPAKRQPCADGFHWCGQSYATCDDCGLPAWEHAGMAELVPDAADARSLLFGPSVFRLRPWREGEADAVRAKWDPELPVWRCPGSGADPSQSYAGLVPRGRMWGRGDDEDTTAPPECPDHPGEAHLVATTRGRA